MAHPEPSNSHRTCRNMERGSPSRQCGRQQRDRLEYYDGPNSIGNWARAKEVIRVMSDAVTLVFIVLVTVVVSLIGLALVRRTVPSSRLAQHTDVAGYVYAVIGVIYAVILALVVVAAWEEYRDAQAAVAAEASSVLNLARMANGWPADDRANVESALVAYARQTVDVEWPAMARGDFAPATETVTVNQLWQALNEADETAATKSASYQAALLQLANLDAARGDRLLFGQDGLPIAMALILILGAGITVAFTYLFAVDDARLQAVMIASLAVLVALLLMLQYQLGKPFQGVAAIEPTAMELVLAEIDSGTGMPGMSN
jgi:hypothetical protein